MFLLFYPTLLHSIWSLTWGILSNWSRAEVVFFFFLFLHWCVLSGWSFSLPGPSLAQRLWLGHPIICTEISCLCVISFEALYQHPGSASSVPLFIQTLFKACSQWLHNLSSLLSLIIGSLLVSLFSWFVEYCFNTSCTGNFWSHVYVPKSFLPPFLHFLGTCVCFPLCAIS